MTTGNSGNKQTFNKIEHASISLPKGGGAIRGVGEKFQANPVTGGGSFSLPLPLAPGRGGFQPELNLSYDSGAGNGRFGLGWNCGVPSITRKTDKELPLYLDGYHAGGAGAMESDTFILAGAEDLVPVLNAAGTERESYSVTETENAASATYTVYRYMPRIEGLFAKIEKWVDNETKIFHWRVTTKENITSIYGKNAGSRIFDPLDSTKIFEWMIERSFDAKGNVIIYEYKQEDSGNIPDSINEIHRVKNNTGFANRHLKRVKYSSFDGDTERFHFQLVFDYGEHGADTPEETTVWPCRMDPYSTFKPGFEIRNYRLCRRVLMFHNFPGLTPPAPLSGSERGGDSWELVKSMELTYEENETLTKLISAVIKGYKKTAAGYETKSMPAVEFAYSEPEPGTEIKRLDPESARNLPAGLDEQTYQWIDLKGEGSPGVLSRNGNGIYYKENLGNGKLGEMRALATLPLAGTGEGGSGPLQVMDIDGDGVNELVVRGDGLNGYYRCTDKGWENFIPFKDNPVVDWNDPNLKMIDLNGDGHADIVISERHAFRCWHSKGAEGYESGIKIPHSDDELKGPAVVFSDPAQSIYLADMTGDGLTDIVRIRNGEVCYWPNLGHGRFGARIVMDNSPKFTANGKNFNQHYIKLGDIDGSGTTDIVYLGNGRVEIYYNCAGNGFSTTPRTPIGGKDLEAVVPGINFPPVDSLTSVTMIDLLGKGTMCLVWSTQRPGVREKQMSYVDLMGTKPHLLCEVNDNMGSVIKLSYVPSTKFYLEDKAAGKPWITKLSFPIHCLERVETIDEISGSRLVTQYRYHHGYFDGKEREFRGFGMVEVLDTESFEEYDLTPRPPASTKLSTSLPRGEGGALGGEVTVKALSPAGEGGAAYVAPVLTKTWYHTGAFVEAGKISKQYEKEYYQGDENAFLLPDTVIEDFGALETQYAASLREAYRALKGSALRQEIYEAGVDTPYQVKEANFTVKLLQAKYGNKHAVFFTHANEAITFHYEKIQDDPRVTHELALEVDDFGNVKRSLDLVYPRRSHPPAPSPEGRGGEFPEQQKAYATLTAREYINETVEFYRVGVPYEETVYELKGPLPVDAYTQLSMESARAFVSEALVSPLNPPEGDLNYQNPTAIVVSTARCYFWNDAQSSALPLGRTSARALEHHIETAALTPGLVTQAYGTAVTGAMLADAGYVLRDGVYYNPGLTQRYSMGGFYLPVRTEDPFGGFIQITYDDYRMFPIKTEDALGNASTALMDYRSLTPKRLTDANGNASEAVTDELGMVIATSVYGSEEGVEKGDMPLDLTPRPPLPGGEGGIVDDIIANPLDYLHDATTYFYYDLFSWSRDRKPPHFVELARETHVRDLAPEETTRVKITVGFSDGFERELQTKVKVEPGLAWVPSPPAPLPGGEGSAITYAEEYTEDRWLVSGRTVYNNKQKPVKQYEPFYSGTAGYEDEEFFAAYGVTPVLHYDPLLRVVRTDTPKGFFSKVEFTPWEVRTYDENDTVLDSDYYARYATLSAEEKEALDKAAVHYNTPRITKLDTLGREFMRIEYKIDIDQITSGNRAENELITYTEYTIAGKPRTIADPRQYAQGIGTKNYIYTYDMADRIIRTQHIDGADDLVLFNALTNPVMSMDAKGYIFSITYDLLQRPITKTVVGDGLNNTVERLIYGESQPAPEVHNLRGKLYRHYDQAGRVTNGLYSFKGEPITSERRVRTEYKLEADWATGIDWDTLLDPEAYTNTIQYDALGKITEQINPDTSIAKPEYHLSGNLDKVNVQLKGEMAFTQFVTGIAYNPKGQRERITYGNGTRTDYAYERETFRLTSLLTTRLSDSHVLQNIAYTYDPVGNITLVNDASIPTVFNNNQIVEPKQKYTYDALYRLLVAEGREHTALNNPDYYKDPNAFKQSAFIHLVDVNDSNKLSNYTRYYSYDNAGNLNAIQHVAADSQRSFTREINVDDVSNRWLPANMGVNPDFSQYYDANGNIKELEHLQALNWNYRDNIASVVLLEREGGPDDTEYYVYDSSGQRVRKVRETLRTESIIEYDEKIYLGGVEIKRIRANTTQELERSTNHVMDDKSRIAVVHNWSLDVNEREINSSVDLDTNKTRYQYGNHLDSASLELDPYGAIISYEEYFPYGDTSFIAGTNQKEVKLKEYRYTGKERDDATGLYYFGARYYASWCGRWLSADPLFRENPAVFEKPKPGSEEEKTKQEEEFAQKLYSEGLNLFWYVKSNPIIHADLMGFRVNEENIVPRMGATRSLNSGASSSWTSEIQTNRNGGSLQHAWEGSKGIAESVYGGSQEFAIGIAKAAAYSISSSTTGGHAQREYVDAAIGGAPELTNSLQRHGVRTYIILDLMATLGLSIAGAANSSRYSLGTPARRMPRSLPRATSPIPGSFFGRRISMANAPESSALTALGFRRNAPWFWRQMLSESPEMFSVNNIRLIRQGRSPIVDRQWINYNPSHQSFMRDRLVHHHINQGDYATGIPETVHRAWNLILHVYRGN